ncbi:MAG TPA: hypothetical protein VMI31_15435 [Fimbriimonadaceae bacterium]|nr:hypothetical protein [Fimbriimonadaceae bacterium]
MAWPRSQTCVGLAFAAGVVGLSLYLGWRGWLRWQPKSIDDPHVRALVARVEQVYASCRSYADTGEVDGPSVGLKITFRTAYAAPGKLRFEFADHDPTDPARGLLICDGTREPMRFGGVDTTLEWRTTYSANVMTWYSGKAKAEKTSVALGVAGLTGLSGGAAHAVPRLLLPDDVHGLRPGQVVDLKLTGTTAVDGFECYVLASKEQQTTWFIDTANLLIRREIDAFTGTTFTISYRPELDGAVDGRLFVKRSSAGIRTNDSGR